MSCASWETTLEFALDELPEAEAADFELHYFGCDRCLQRLDRLQRVLERLRSSLPLVLTPERRLRLVAGRPHVQAVDLLPGERATLRLSAEDSVGIWVMHAPLQQATRVDLEVRTEDGTPVFTVPNVPFDASRGEVAMPCQFHFRAVADGRPLEVALTASRGADKSVTKYFLEHVFESS